MGVAASTANDPGVGGESAPDDQVGAAVGARLRLLRLEAGLTLTGLAERAGLSKAHLSRLESGERGFTLANLVVLAERLGVPISSLVPTEGRGRSRVVHAEGPVVRAAGLQVRPLSRLADAGLKPLHVTVPADREWSDDASHPGEEWIYVLSGVVTVVHGNNADTLTTGDSIHLDATVPHHLVTPVGAEIIVVASASPTKETDHG